MLRCYERVVITSPLSFLSIYPITRLTEWPISATLFKFPRIAVRVLCLFLELRRSPDLPSSNTQGALAFSGWFLYVRLHHWHFAVTMCHITQLPTSSWEFLITLDYEWNIIRGRRRYRWTIWVCNNSLFCDIPAGDNLICSSGRSTPLPVWPPSWLSV
jgi:hypothetical protein